MKYVVVKTAHIRLPAC